MSVYYGSITCWAARVHACAETRSMSIPLYSATGIIGRVTGHVTMTFYGGKWQCGSLLGMTSCMGLVTTTCSFLSRTSTLCLPFPRSSLILVPFSKLVGAHELIIINMIETVQVHTVTSIFFLYPASSLKVSTASGLILINNKCPFLSHSLISWECQYNNNS